MNFADSLFPAALYWVADIVFAVLLVAALLRAPWERLHCREQLNLLLGASVALLLLWSMKAGIYPGLNYHLLGGTLFLLMFGWPFALLGMTLVLAGVTLNGAADWQSFALNALLLAALPVFLSHVLLHFAVRYLPHHFFIYTLFNGFFAGGLTMLATVIVASLLLLCCGPYTAEILASKYLPFAPFMVFAEAFFTGMVVSSLVLWRPEWISSFDDQRYLSGK